MKVMEHYTMAKKEMDFFGIEQTSLQNLLAILIGPTAKPAVTGELAALGVKRLLSLSDNELLAFEGVNASVVERLHAALGLGLMMNKYKLADKPYIISSPKKVVEYFKDMLMLEQECFDVLFLNKKNMVIGRKNIFKGTLTEALVHPREVYKEAFKRSAVSIIVAHNHPSTNISVSAADIDVTKKFYETGLIVGIELLDHVVIGEHGKYISLKEKGYIR